MLLKISITEQDLVSAEALTNLISALRTIADSAQRTKAPDSGTDTAEPETKKPEPKAKAKATKKPEPEPEPKPEPEPEPEENAEVDYKALREEVRKELGAIARKGKTAGLKALLEKHGVQKLSDIPDESLNEVLEAAKAL